MTTTEIIVALVKNNTYNKIMLNFAGSLLLAFLILVIIRVCLTMLRILT